MIAALIVVTVAALVLAFWMAWDRAERKAYTDDLEEAIADAEAQRDHARGQHEQVLRANVRWRRRAKDNLVRAVDAEAHLQMVAAQVDETAATLARREQELLDLALADRVLPDLRDPLDLMVPTYPIGDAPIFERLRGESQPLFLVLPAEHLIENTTDQVEAAICDQLIGALR